MSLLELREVTLRFGGLVAVDNLSLTVEEIFALVGPNGAGKSTVFNLISRFYDPAAGSIHFDGNELLNSNADQVSSLGIARTFQNIELFEQASVLQNLLVGRHRHWRTHLLSDILFSPKAYREELRHREAVEKVIDFLNLEHYRDKRIGGLPYGVRKVVELWSCLGIRAKAAPVGRARLRTVGRRNAGYGLLDRGYSKADGYLRDDRARHGAGLCGIGARYGALGR